MPVNEQLNVSGGITQVALGSARSSAYGRQQRFGTA
jgi:hypothetical protein